MSDTVPDFSGLAALFINTTLTRSPGDEIGPSLRWATTEVTKAGIGR